MKVPSIIARNVQKDSIKGSIGRKWAVDGVTTFPIALDTIHVEVTQTTKTKSWVVMLAALHEKGHAFCGQDVVRNVDHSSGAYKLLGTYDKWQSEVEAWMRGLEHRGIDYADGTFILDCLNSYRRGIPATEEQWQEAIELLGTVYAGDVQDLRDYLPLEPDPGEKLRECLPDFTKDDGRSDDDEREEKDDKGDDKGDQRNDYDEANPFDLRWLAQNILDKVAGGSSIEAVAAEYDLDPTRLPPLLAAMKP